MDVRRLYYVCKPRHFRSEAPYRPVSRGLHASRGRLNVKV